MREKDECGPNIGLVRLLIYLCQADFNTGATDLSRLSSPSPDAESVNTEHLNRKQLYLCACITEREIPTTFIMFREAMEHEKRRKLFIGKTQIALLLPLLGGLREEGFALTILATAPAFHLLLDLLH